MKKLKILMVTPALNLCGGIESYAMNYYTHFDDRIEMDFATHDVKDNYYKKIIEKKGNKVFIFPKLSLKNIIEFEKQLDCFFKEHNDYDIIHCNMANAGLFYFKYAKKYNIPIRIIHSHQDTYADKWSHAIRNIPLLKKSVKMSNMYFACSKNAGDFLFGNKKYNIINNAIDLDKFNYNIEVREKIRKELNIEDKFVIGNVGRFCAQKNQLFLIDVFYKILQEHNNSVLLLIGNGELEKDINKKIDELGIKTNVIIIESTNNIQNYYQAMDVFVLPSLYEGLAFVSIEAQATGLKVIASNTITSKAKITENMEFLDLNDSQEKWSKEILKFQSYNRRACREDIIKANFDIVTEAKKLEDLYFEIFDRKDYKEDKV